MNLLLIFLGIKKNVSSLDEFLDLIIEFLGGE